MKFLGYLLLAGLLSYLDQCQSLPRIRRAPQDVKFVMATVGSTVTLQCNTQHNKFDMVEWRRNDSTVPVIMQFLKYDPNMAAEYAGRVQLVNKKDLEIENVGPKDQSIYLCKTMISTNEITTFEKGSPIKLTVQERPSCRGTPPSFITAVVGSSTLLPCEPVGNPEPKVTWSRTDGTLPLGRYSMTNRGLGIKDVASDDSGRYQVTLRSDAGTFAHVIELVVRTTSSVLPGNYINAVEDQIARVPCGSGVSDKRASVVWTRDGADATRDPRFTIANAGMLVVNTARRGDSALYVCSVRKRQDDGKMVTISEDMYLNVQFLPNIVYSQDNVKAVIDTTVELPCVATGNPEVKVTWIKGGVSIKQSDRVEVTANGSLSLENVTMKDEGYYTCAPYNKLGSGTRRDTLLTVLVPPSFINNPRQFVTVGYKKNATLDCQASGKPRPNITWFPVETNWPYGRVAEANGILTIINTVPQDHGRYRCMVSSVAGSLIRDFVIKVASKPDKPLNLSVITKQGTRLLTWLPGYDGGSLRTFQVWYRPSDSSDHYWKYHKLGNPNATSFNFSDLSGQGYLFAVRARNSKGYGPYSDIVTYNASIVGVSNLGAVLSEQPLYPTDMQVNVTEDGYVISWSDHMTPGRPPYTHFVIEMKKANTSAGWKDVSGVIPSHLRSFLVKLETVDSSTLYKFRMFAVAGALRSEAATPSVWHVIGVPKPVSPTARSSDGNDSLPGIVLGAMFAVFVFILIISLICFLRASRRRNGQRRGKRAKKVQFDLIRNEYPGEGADDESFDGDEVTKNGKVPVKQKSNGKKMNGEKSILRLGGYENEEFRDLLSAEEARMGVHVILSSKPVAEYDQDRKYLTLPHKPKGVRNKQPPKKKLYKSASSPSVLLTPKGSPDSEKGTDITAEEILDEEEYDVSDVENDVLGQLDSRFSSMKQTKLLDSYDQFCHSTSDFGSKDIVSSSKRRFTDSLDRNKYKSGGSGENSDDSRSPTKVANGDCKLEKDLDETGTLETVTTLPDRGSKENMFDDSNDASSENSVTESERHGAYDVSPLPSPMDTNGDSKPKFLAPSGALNPVDRFLAQQQQGKLGTIAETRSLESYSKSSGFESGGISQSSTSDGESNMLTSAALKMKFRDLESLSDHSARSSPLIGQRRPLFSSISENGEWDRGNSRTPPARFTTLSPDRNQLQEIELTDNEELFDRIMDLQRRLGVDLGDSWEDLTDLRPTYNSRRPTSASYRDGYTSDVPVSYSDKVNLYSENEKNQRCARLLREFKRRSVSDTESPTPLSDKMIRRSNSAVSDYMRSPHKLTPTFNRCNSADADSTGLKEVIYREWLV